MAIFHEELGYYGITTALSVTSIVGNAIIHMGNEDQKKEDLPALAAGRLLFSLGHTEPNAGSDLASLETNADLVKLLSVDALGDLPDTRSAVLLWITDAEITQSSGLRKQLPWVLLMLFGLID